MNAAIRKSSHKERHIDDPQDVVIAYRTLAEHRILDAYGHVVSG